MNNDISTPQGVVSALRRIAETDTSADLSAVSKTVETIEAERKGRITKSLQGVADLAVLGGSKGHRFLLAYWKNNQAYTAEGVDYAYGQYIPEKDESDLERVHVNNDDYVEGDYYTMSRLKKTLDERKIPYVIVYFDK